MPDLLTPKPPSSARGAVAEQVDRIADTPADVVRQQLELCRNSAGQLPLAVRDAADRGTFAIRAAMGLRYFWKAELAERWAALCQTLQTDMAHRSDDIAAKGLGAALRSLHPLLGWDGTTLRVDLPWEETHSYANAEVVLAPSALNWPRLSAQLCHPDQAVLFYAVDAVAPHPPAHSRPATEQLIGRSRATILSRLDVALSTTALAGLMGLTPATVSFHLGVLHRAGLVIRTRDHHEVLYRRSPAGSQLLSD